MTTFNDPRLSDAREGTAHDNPSLADRVINLSKQLSDSNDAMHTATQQLELANNHASTWKNSHARLVNKIDAVAETIITAIKNDDVDVDTVKKIARQLNIDLIREAKVKFVVKFEGTIGVPLDFCMDNLEDQFTFEVSDGYNSSIEFSDFNIDLIEVEVDDV
jgi:hypothetical protein